MPIATAASQRCGSLQPGRSAAGKAHRHSKFLLVHTHKRTNCILAPFSHSSFCPCEGHPFPQTLLFRTRMRLCGCAHALVQKGLGTRLGRVQPLCIILVGVVSVSALGGKNEWVSTARYTISVRCPDLGGVRFSEVANVLVLR